MIKYIKMINLLKISVLALVVVGFSSCLKGSSNSNSSASSVSFVSLMHMAPYTASSEIYFNNVKQTSAITAGTFSNSYGQIPPGLYDVQYKVAGSDSVLADIPSSAYDSLGFYTIALYNPTAGSTAVNAVKIYDDFSTLSTSNANVRLMDFCPDLGPVDVFLGSTQIGQSRSNGDNVTNSVYNMFLPQPSGVYTLQVRKAGTDSLITFSGSSASYNAAGAYTILLMESYSNGKASYSSAVITASY